MQHALDLARKAAGLASPNPLVGCVIVNNGEIVGQGFHEYDGRSHAEILALKAAGEKSRGATVYVTLEPCNHTGRTGPCCDALIAAGVGRVVAAMEDPNPAVSGRGFEKLRAAGITVETGLLEEPARKLNESFACWIRTQKPFVTLKSALTLDGQLALPQGQGISAKKTATHSSNRSSATWITSEESRAEVHLMRHASDALLTGIGSVLADNPLLTDRSGLSRRKRLVRVVLDSKLRIPPKSRIVKTADDDLLVFTAATLDSPKARKLQNAGVEIVRAGTWRGVIDLAAVLTELGRREILSVLLEAGPALNGAALSSGFVDKLVLFYAPKIAGKSGVPLAHAPKLDRNPLRDIRTQQFGLDVCIEGYVHKPARK